MIFGIQLYYPFLAALWWKKQTPMALCLYVVLVQFEPTGELSSDSSNAVVPASWIKDDECKWPSNNKNINSLIKKRKGPAPDWKSFPIEKIIGICGTYDIAREREKRYALTSNSENEEVLDKANGTSNLFDISTQDVFLPDINSNSDVLKLLMELKTMMNHLAERFINNHYDVKVVSKPDLLPTLPLTSVEQVQYLETQAGDDVYEQLVLLVSKTGGTDLKNYIKRVLEIIFTDDLATNYSWNGQKNNIPLKGMKIIKSIKDGIKITMSYQDLEFEKHTMDWFRYAKSRRDRRQK
ncbi:hypothetical protein FQR65_LT13664 [Abscondita terminalis]|nr:hypothetical protein FQR65_LT13664 [Abscondita terminalis]